MKLKLFLIAASAMALASCSSDEVVKNNEDANAIQFSVVANNGSRAADYWCNYNLPTQFNVWAAVGDNTYFAGESYSNSDGIWSIDGDLRYWPASGTDVSFYAAKIKADAPNDTENFATFKWLNDSKEIEPTISMTTKSSASEQNDLLYAYTVKSRPASGGKVEINFRHALSQVVFYAQNDNKNIFVKIDEIQICNIKKTGTFNFPTEVTDKNFESHNQSGNLDEMDGSNRKYAGIGNWSALSDVFNTTTGVFDTKSIQAKQANGSAFGKVNLTDNAAGTAVTNPEANLTNSLLLIPQKANAWVATGEGKKAPTAAGQDGAYFKVKCQIWNLAAGDGLTDKANDILLWDNKKTVGDSQVAQYIYVPVKIDWAVGKKYIYTIHFTTTGHGGYDEDGNDVLIPITFDVKVDDFAAGTDKDVNVDSGIVNP